MPHEATEEISRVWQELKDPRASYRLRTPQSRRLGSVKSSQSGHLLLAEVYTQGHGGFQLHHLDFWETPISSIFPIVK